MVLTVEAANMVQENLCMVLHLLMDNMTCRTSLWKDLIAHTNI
jgi:hypothetical protein